MEVYTSKQKYMSYWTETDTQGLISHHAPIPIPILAMVETYEGRRRQGVLAQVLQYIQWAYRKP